MLKRKIHLLFLLSALLLFSQVCSRSIPEDTKKETPTQILSPINNLPYDLLFSTESIPAPGFYLFNSLPGNTTYLTQQSQETILDSALSPNGSYLAYENRSGIYLSKFPFVSTQQIAESGSNSGRDLKFNENGEKLAYIANDDLYIWDIPSSNSDLLLKHNEIVEEAYSYHPYSWSTDGQWLIISKDQLHNYKFLILNTVTKQLFQIKNDPPEIFWIPNKPRLIAAVSYDCMAQTGFKDGIYSFEIQSDKLKEDRMFYKETDPECDERGYYIHSVDSTGEKVIMGEWTADRDKLGTFKSSSILLTITTNGIVSEQIPHGDLPIFLTNGKILLSYAGEIIIFDPISSRKELIYTSPSKMAIPYFLSPNNDWILVAEDQNYFVVNLTSRSVYPVLIPQFTGRTFFQGWVRND